MKYKLPRKMKKQFFKDQLCIFTFHDLELEQIVYTFHKRMVIVRNYLRAGIPVSPNNLREFKTAIDAGLVRDDWWIKKFARLRPKLGPRLL